MAITRLESSILLTSEEVNTQYDGRWVIFSQEGINSQVLIRAYRDNSSDTTEE